MQSCLEGVRVVEFSEGWRATALTGKLLAELGAEVIKVEIGEGDALRDLPPRLDCPTVSYAYAMLHCNKKGIFVSGLGDEVSELIGKADILLVDVQYARTKGFFTEILRLPLAETIKCFISPFGISGPLSHYWGSDLTVQAAGGILITTGQPDAVPVRAGFSFSEQVGSIFAFLGTVSSLEYRRQTRQGQVVDISLQDCMVSFLTTFLPDYFETGRAPKRLGNRHPMSVPWNSFEAKDGWVIICISTDQLWEEAVRVMKLEDPGGRFATQGQRLKYLEEAEALISGWVSQHTVEEIITILEGASIPSSRIRTLGDLFQDEYFTGRQMLNHLDIPGLEKGGIMTTGTLFKMSLTPGRVTSPGPALGQDNAHYGFPSV